MIREERPIVARTDVAEEKALAEFVDRVIRWIDATHQEANGALVIGVFGGRGTGKTSALETLHERLRERKSWVLPGCTANGPAALFRPAETRDHDDLLFLLLRHFEVQYRRDGNGKGAMDCIRKIRKLEIRRREPTRFLDYEKEVGASRDDLEKRLTDFHIEVASGTEELRTAFRDLIERLRDDGTGTVRGPLVLLIDDLDLQPHRGLEMLEILHLFLNWSGVIVLVAADRDLLLDSIRRSLARRGIPQRGLAAALLAKYIAYPWEVPIPTPRERFELLWQTWPVLEPWWPTGEQLNTYGLEPSEARTYSEQALAEHLPHSYRGLKTLHNRLEAEISGEEFLALLVDRLGVAPDFVRPLMAMLVTLDVRFPELDILDLARKTPAGLRALFDELAPPREKQSKEDQATSQDDKKATSQDDKKAPPRRLAKDIAAERLDRMSGLRGRDRDDAVRALEAFASTWRDFVDKTLGRLLPEPAKLARFLAISHMANAKEAARSQWENHFTEDQIWHIDLQEYGHDVASLREARGQARQELQEKRILAFDGSLLVHIKACLSLVLWLGWTLRQLLRNEVTAINSWPGGVARFPRPQGPIQRGGTYRRMEAERHGNESRSSQAILVIDLTIDRQSRAEQLERFVDDSGTPVTDARMWRLLGPGGTVEPDDLVPLLEDMLELFGRLGQDGVEHFHLGFAGPDVVAFFLGAQLNARGRISLYEWSPSQNRYEYVFDLADP